ncbi:MAG: cell division protein FtsQ/DivIB [Hyphomonadaceae bacterium]
MAPVRGRRTTKRRQPAYYEPPEPPKPRAKGTPRLATLALDREGAMERPQVTKRGLAIAAALTVFTIGFAIAGATFIGGSLFDVREAAAVAADRTADGIGFSVDHVEIAGVEGARADEIRALILPENRRSLIAVDPRELQTDIESLDWVSRASVRRLFPSTIRIDVVRRAAFARWQENGVVSVIDHLGERLFAERVADNLDLPLVVGEGAGPAAAPLLNALERLPETRRRTRAIVRVGDRRWNLRLNTGATVALPENDPVSALASLERLQQRYVLLDRPVYRIDLRLPGRAAVRVHPYLAGARRERGEV